MPDHLTHFLFTALSSGIAVVVVQFALEWYREWRDKQHFLKFLALEICICLERYAVKLAKMVTDENEIEVEPGEYVVNLIQHIPELNNLPISEHYNKFDSELLNQVYEIPDHISLANGQANIVVKMESRKEGIKHATELACSIGLSAIDLAKRIRSKYRLQGRKLAHDAYDVPKILESRIKIE